MSSTFVFDGAEPKTGNGIWNTTFPLVKDFRYAMEFTGERGTQYSAATVGIDIASTDHPSAVINPLLLWDLLENTMNSGEQ
jgi:hypothetical protein